MIFIKNRLIFGLISKAIKTVFKVIYKFLSFFNLHLTMLVAIIGAILYLTGVLTSSSAVLMVFYVLLILSVVYAIIASIRKLLGLNKKVDKKGSMQIINSTGVDKGVPDDEKTGLPESKISVQDNNAIKPLRYFAVKSNPNVIVAEYVDKYVLYLKTANGYKYLRTDNK